MEPTNKAGEGSRSDNTAGEGRTGARAQCAAKKIRGVRVLAPYFYFYF